MQSRRGGYEDIFSCETCSRSQTENISLVISTDTDVVVLAISMFEKLAKDKLWIAFGKGKYLQWIPIHGVSISLGPRALGLPFVHALLIVTQYQSFVEKVSEQHGRHGKYLMMRQIRMLV